ncbi:MAG: c-di-GMP phosphodiesterase [Leptospiraceae bacterium]|nr:c-di-GMP phosphodiesterase [Leptospiraceae bacterium]MCK6381571.1 c-di-GMP phosphodiesterase [Leptospiraceae bacterium]NUM42653.1 c-di-GMP phosphodiesterase [Leptospiraceae bacterium]
MAAPQNTPVKEGYKQFDFTEEVLQTFREQSVIPIDFYNRDGQILIHKKEGASTDDINRLLRFEAQGIFFRNEDYEKLFSKQSSRPTHVNGREVSFTKLVNVDLTKDLAKDTKNLLGELKTSPFQGRQFANVSKSIDNILTDFSNSNDVETGLVNIIEVMGGTNAGVDSEIITKRTVIGMALKLRGMKAISRAEKEIQKAEQMTMMMSSYLCDIGYSQMKIPEHGNISVEEYNYIKNHPMVSYLMLAPLEEIDTKIKSNVLNHHRPYKGESLNNNYPSAKVIVEKLSVLQKKYSEDSGKAHIARDITQQIKHILTYTGYEEDTGIISIAGEFAAMTTAKPWRDAMDSMTAMKIILNNSFFTYNEKIVKDFFDYVGHSLCDNRSILNRGDYVITAHSDSGKKVHFEICIIVSINRSQTRPMLERIGTIQPIFSNVKKLEIKDFNLTTMKLDRRKARYNLESGDPRRIVFIVDPGLNPILFDEIDQQYRRTNPKNAETTSKVESKQ